MPGVRPSDCGLSVLLSEPGSTPAVEMLSHNVSRPHNADMIGDDQLVSQSHNQDRKKKWLRQRAFRGRGALR